MSKRPISNLLRGLGRHPLNEPYLLFLIWVGIGVGTVLLRQAERMALLWTVMVLLSLLYRAQKAVDLGASATNTLRGAALGLVIALPILAFLSKPLADFSQRLYNTSNPVLLFYQVCFVAAPVEEYFFRGILYVRKGPSVALGCYAGMALLLYLPHVPPLAALLVCVALGILGIVYGYVRERYGLAAAIACHVMVGFTLQVLPAFIAELGALLA